MDLSIVTSQLERGRGDGAHQRSHQPLAASSGARARGKGSTSGQRLSAHQAQAIAVGQCVRSGMAFERPRVADAGCGLWRVDMGAGSKFTIPAMSRRDWYGWLDHFYGVDAA